MTDTPSTIDAVRLGIQTRNAISARMEELGWTQADLARETGLTPKHINQIMQGKATGSPVMLDFVAFVLGCEWDVTLRAVDIVERS